VIGITVSASRSSVANGCPSLLAAKNDLIDSVWPSVDHCIVEPGTSLHQRADEPGLAWHVVEPHEGRRRLSLDEGGRREQVLSM
jgi:hypothetical protein